MVLRVQGAPGFDPFPVEPGPDGFAMSSKADGYFADGELRIAGATLTSGIASNQSFRLANPSASGKLITVLAAFVAADQPATYRLNKNGTLGAPAAVVPWNPNFAASDATVALAQSQATAFTGGTLLDAYIRVAANILVKYDVPILLPEGLSVGLTATFSVSATSFIGVLYREHTP